MEELRIKRKVIEELSDAWETKNHPSQGGLVFVGFENILRKRNVLVSHCK